MFVHASADASSTLHSVKIAALKKKKENQLSLIIQ
jgi:hypothetical protein